MPQTITPSPPFQLSESTRPDCDFACCSNSEIVAQIDGKTYTSEFYCTTDITPGPEDSFILADGTRIYSLTAAGRSSTITQLHLRSDDKDPFASMSIRKIIASSQSRDLAILCQKRGKKNLPTNVAFRLRESNGTYDMTPLFNAREEIRGIHFVEDSILGIIGADQGITVQKEDGEVIASANCRTFWGPTVSASANARYILLDASTDTSISWSVLDCETGIVKSVGPGPPRDNFTRRNSDREFFQRIRRNGLRMDVRHTDSRRRKRSNRQPIRRRRRRLLRFPKLVARRQSRLLHLPPPQPAERMEPHQQPNNRMDRIALKANHFPCIRD